MHRFFSQTIKCGQITLSPEDINHAANVLRLAAGDEIIVCDGCSNDYICRIQQISKKEIKLEALSHKINDTEPQIKITLFQGLPKSDKMELIIQKSVELGVNAIVPVESARSVAKMKGGSSASVGKKMARWQNIALSAAKQCGRGIVPAIGAPQTFTDALGQMGEFDHALIPYELERQKTLKSAVCGIGGGSMALFIGPEGGFEAYEIEAAKAAGILPISLGKRVLRTETAGFTAITMIFTLLGEYDG